MKIENKISYWIGIIASSAWFIYIIITPFYDYRKDSKEITLVLSENPTFKTIRNAKTTRYSVELNFVDDNSIYEIVGPEYKYLKKEKFKREILKGDTLKFVAYENKIYSLSKKEMNYMNYNNSESYKKREIVFMSIIMVLLFTFCLLPLTFQNRIKSTYRINNIIIKYNYIFYLLGFLVIFYIYFYRE